MNIDETITNRIAWQLEAGIIPWRQTWARGLPRSLPFGREYRGVNILILGSADFTSRYWISYHDVLRLEAKIRKGQRPTPVVFWKWHTPDELAKRRQQAGMEPVSAGTPFTGAVFNLDQVKGIQRPKDDVPIRPCKQLFTADQVYDVMPDKPSVLHMRADAGDYNPNADHVIMPHLSQFDSAQEYYATLFHQLAHATGHRKRLSRFGTVKGDRFDPHSFEELVAELGAAFLCGFAGIPNPPLDRLQECQISGWAKALRDDPRMVMRAASAAQKAADYIRGKLPSELAAPASRSPRQAIASSGTAAQAALF